MFWLADQLNGSATKASVGVMNLPMRVTRALIEDVAGPLRFKVVLSSVCLGARKGFELWEAGRRRRPARARGEAAKVIGAPQHNYHAFSSGV